jgi:hypothetical protein
MRLQRPIWSNERAWREAFSGLSSIVMQDVRVRRAWAGVPGRLQMVKLKRASFASDFDT